MPFDPVAYRPEEPPSPRPEPFASTGWQEAALLWSFVLVGLLLLLLVLFPMPLILLAEAFDYVGGR